MINAVLPFVGVFLVAQATQEQTLDDYKALLGNNIFSPVKAKKVGSPAREKSKEGKKEAIKNSDLVLVTGFTFVEEHQGFEAVIEDKKKKEIRFAKPGDVVEGWTIVSVAHEVMVVSQEGKEREFKVGEAIVGVEPLGPPSEAEVDPKKIEETRQRRREQLGKKTMPEDEESEMPAEKKKKK